MPNEVQNVISDLYGNFTTRIACKDYITYPVLVERGVLQGNCLRLSLFNLVFNSFIQTIKSDEFKELIIINKTNDLILNLTPENVTQHSRIE